MFSGDSRGGSTAIGSLMQTGFLNEATFFKKLLKPTRFPSEQNASDARRQGGGRERIRPWSQPLLFQVLLIGYRVGA